MKRLLLNVAVLAAVVAGVSGCGVIYSTQKYGSPGTQRVTEGATRADVFANMGTPNSIHSEGGQEFLVYKYAEGVNYLGLVSKIRRTDTVVVINDAGLVEYAGEVPVGKGLTILSGPVLDATHPVRTSTLLFEPENYGSDQEGE
ncbi:hypothetical protein HZA57_09125 [Candidatus Poribacteria bacterium]|nr:hypothetical protein [Candidatus Poribacteria bacterium]